MKKFIYETVILGLFFANATIAQQRDLWTTFTTADGLAGNNVTAILESSDGALWFGTVVPFEVFGQGLGGVSRLQDGRWTIFTTADGLANNNVNAIFESSDRALWFGTDGGISRFQDGLWKTFTANDGLAADEVQAITASKDGALWIITQEEGEGKGVSRYQNGIWTAFTSANGLAHDEVSSILTASDGAVWFGTSHGASLYRNGRWATFTTTHGLAGDEVGVIIETKDGALWFGTTNGASKYHNGIWQTFTEANGLANNHVGAILETSDGALWFGTLAGISRYQNDHWQTFTTTDGLGGNVALPLLESSEGDLWCSTFSLDDPEFGTGVSRYRTGKWKTFTTKDSLASNFVQTIFESSDGALWFGTLTRLGTTGGLSRYEQAIWATFTKADGLPGPFIFITSILNSRDDAMWVGTNGGGASRYQNDRWRTFTTTDGLGGNIVSHIFESKLRDLWFVTSTTTPSELIIGTGVTRYRNGAWEIFDTTNGLASNEILSVLESQNGVLWFGTDNGVGRYENGVWTTLTTAEGLASNYVNDIFESSDGALWFGTYDGLSRFKDNRWTTFTTDSGLVDNDVEAIIESKDGAMWIRTDDGEGVNRYHHGVWTTFTEQEGLINNDVNIFFASSDGAVWFATNFDGVSRYQNGRWTTFTENNGLADNTVTSIIETSDGAIWFGSISPILGGKGGVSRYKDGVWITFSKADGLVDNIVFAMTEAHDHALWFGTASGVSRFKPDRTPPYTFIVSGPKPLVGTPTPLFEIGGRDFRTPQDRITYSYAVVNSSIRLDDSHWQPYSSRTAIQPFIPLNGNYTFYVRARDGLGNPDPTPATWPFTVDATQPTVTFNSHKANDIVAGKVVLIGNAFDASPIQDFDYYNLLYGFGKTQNDVKEWKDDRFSKLKTTPVSNDTLAIWNTEGLPNNTYWLQLSAYDTLKHESHVFLNLVVVKSAATVDSRSGSNFVLDASKLELYFPPNTFPKDTPLNVSDCPIQDIVPKADPQVTFANLCFEIAPRELRLDKPATLMLHYPDSVLTNKNEKKLALYHSPNGKDSWQRLGGSIDVEKNKITTTFKQAGVFALYEDLSTGNKAGILNVTSQPRVFSPQGGGFNTQTAISFDLGKESNVTIKIYNAAGRLVRVLTENEPMSYGTQVKSWDGKDQSGHYCLSGLHLVTIQAEDKMVTKTVVVLNK